MKFTTIALVASSAYAADFEITCDNAFELYVDGELIGLNGDWT